MRACVIAILIAIVLLPAGASAQTNPPAGDAPFSVKSVEDMAAELSKKPFSPPPEQLAEKWAKLDYDKYRDIRFRRDRAIWRGENRGFELHVLPAGWLYKVPVTIHIVENGRARLLAPDNSLFDFGALVGPPPPDTAMSFSGFRINGPINRRDVFDEIVVFQGASYFRGVSRDQAYGLSARGLAIDTAQPNGEEFPFFREFWIETPPRGGRQAVIHALLDSPSTTGAYTFRIAGGAPTTVDVDVKLFARRDIFHVGIAPLTSMFLFSDIDRARVSDFRRAVHDSDGVAIADRGGERIWRPLSNPKRLQVSAFGVRDLRGFGLIQRRRRFADYQDLEAHYERRPSAWIEPSGAWGNGSVHLIEIPSEEEIHDNIVAFWRPLEPYRKNEAYRFGYRVLWSNDVPLPADRAVVLNTFSGVANGPDRKSGAIRYVVDYGGGNLARASPLPIAAVSATAGSVSEPVVQRNPETHGVRVDFLLRPGDANLIELRLELKNDDKPISEIWLSRWTN